jgi:hypothetical protein
MLDIAKERLDIELETNQAIIERSQELIDLEKTLMEDEFYQMAELLTLMTDRSEGKAS